MYIYHLIPDPFHGTSLIPLNQMDISSDLYKYHASKYEGRLELMNTIIPNLNCKWNDVIHFSCIDPRIVANEIKKIKPAIQFRRAKYFKIHIDQITNKYRAVIFINNPEYKNDTFQISKNEVIDLSRETYKEFSLVPQCTIDYWVKANQNDQPLLWFAFMPHIFVNEAVDTSEFEVVELI